MFSPGFHWVHAIRCSQVCMGPIWMWNMALWEIVFLFSSVLFCWSKRAQLKHCLSQLVYPISTCGTPSNKQWIWSCKGVKVKCKDVLRELRPHGIFCKSPWWGLVACIAMQWLIKITERSHEYAVFHEYTFSILIILMIIYYIYSSISSPEGLRRGHNNMKDIK